MLDGQLSTEVKYVARYGLSFSPRFCLLKEPTCTTSLERLAFLYPLKRSGLHPKEAGLIISAKCLQCPNDTGFCKKTKTRTDQSLSY